MSTSKRTKPKRKKQMHTYEARVTGDGGKRFTLEMPKPLRDGDAITSGQGGGYKVAYVFKEKGKPVVLLVRTGKRRVGRPRKNER
jgi:hypothetical protein